MAAWMERARGRRRREGVVVGGTGVAEGRAEVAQGGAEASQLLVK